MNEKPVGSVAFFNEDNCDVGPGCCPVNENWAGCADGTELLFVAVDAIVCD